MKWAWFIQFVFFFIFSQSVYAVIMEDEVELLEDSQFTVENGDWPIKCKGRSLKLVSIEKITAFNITVAGITHTISTQETNLQDSEQQLFVNWNRVDRELENETFFLKIGAPSIHNNPVVLDNETSAVSYNHVDDSEGMLCIFNVPLGKQTLKLCFNQEDEIVGIKTNGHRALTFIIVSRTSWSAEQSQYVMDVFLVKQNRGQLNSTLTSDATEGQMAGHSWGSSRFQQMGLGSFLPPSSVYSQYYNNLGFHSGFSFPSYSSFNFPHSSFWNSQALTYGGGSYQSAGYTPFGFSLQQASDVPVRSVNNRVSSTFEDSERKSQSSNKIRRKRFSYNIHQKKELESFYSKNRYPNGEAKNTLANHIGVPVEKVNTWFQNRRAQDAVKWEKEPVSSFY
ncbi:homeobox domain-containing protein [Endozoicomonas sp. Mp262]|uniref:homeobox domain-containing protein n=1 Tax=Endozoicomonas sp. Mp262 TaxID=2919499 RepID=UPI0021DF468B